MIVLVNIALSDFILEIKYSDLVNFSRWLFSRRQNWNIRSENIGERIDGNSADGIEEDSFETRFGWKYIDFLYSGDENENENNGGGDRIIKF